MTILVTGGAGYIGSHTVLALLESGYDVVVVDNLCNSSDVSLRRVESIAKKRLSFVNGDIRDCSLLNYVFSNWNVSSVIHFAGLKSISDSFNCPLEYYDNNVTGTMRLIEAMSSAGIYTLLFSSSATLYGKKAISPINEAIPLDIPVHPYGRSKFMVELFLEDLARSNPYWKIALLRYFNPVGAHPSGLIGESPIGKPNNLLPFISNVAVGNFPELSVFGDDYPTIDGTGVRDYIHVVDLASGHLKALEALRDLDGVHVWNLGTGNGYSVLEMVKAFEKVSGKLIPFNINPRREGDIAVCFADPSKAHAELGWRAKLSLEDMMRDTWRWQFNNPTGYSD